MGERRHHHKTRTGCATCKRRRIKVCRKKHGPPPTTRPPVDLSLPQKPSFPPKFPPSLAKTALQCDERKPVCANCSRRALTCSFLSTAVPASIENGSSAPSIVCPGPLNPAVLQSDPTLYPLGTFDVNPSPVTFGMQDLELLHHFSTSTCYTMAEPDTDRLTTFQINVPKLAFTNDFLMHGLLAVAAIHKAYLLRESDALAADGYHDLAAAHINKSLFTFRLAIQNVTRENCGAILVFSSFISFYVFAGSRSGCNPFNFVDEQNSANATEWLRLIRAGMKLIASHIDWIRESSVGKIIPSRPCAKADLPRSDEAAAIDKRLQHLEKFWTDEKPAEVSFSDGEVASLSAALSSLRRAYRDVLYVQGKSSRSSTRTSTSPNTDLPTSPRDDCEEPDFTVRTSTMVWIYIVDNTYVDMLRRRHPGALVLIAYYGVLVKIAGDFWWFDGLPHAMVRSAVAALPNHLDWIRWPLEKLGLQHPESNGS